MRHLWSLALLLVGCASAGTGSGDDDAVDAPAGPDAPNIDAGPLILTLSQNTDTTLVDNGVACTQPGPPQISTENSYYRSFNLSQYTAASFTAMSVSFGVAAVESSFGSTEVTVKLHRQMGALSTTNLTELHSQPVTLTNDQDNTVVEVPLSSQVFVAASTVLAVEILVPDSTSAGNSRGDLVFIGGNSGGETAPTYWRAPAAGCDFTEPVTMASGGFPNMHDIITVTGTSP